MSSPAIVSLTELTHTFFLLETRNCCKNFYITSCLKKVKNTVNTRIIRTYDFGVQADLVLIYLVLSEKSA